MMRANARKSAVGRRQASKTASKASEQAGSGQGGIVRYLFAAVSSMAVLYIAHYYPYSDESIPGRLLDVYLQVQTALAGSLIALFDRSVHVMGTLITGRFPIKIIKDCASLDAQALLTGAILTFPVRWRFRLAGAVVGTLIINLLNLGRIAALNFVGADAPDQFDSMHEEVMPLLLILGAAAMFTLWVSWAQRLERRGHELLA